MAIIDTAFLVVLAGLLALLLAWGFRRLPAESWQILATMPTHKQTNGSWQGTNLTFYGLFNALACMTAVAMVWVLCAAVGVSPLKVTLSVGIILGACLPASRSIARWVEKKPYTFSIGAASFVGILIGPWVILAVNAVGPGTVPPLAGVMPVLAAMAIAYAFGEGIGRLACISFGCCYGKPVDALAPSWRRLFNRCHFVFTGGTKKAVYAHGLDGRPVVPVQAITASLYCFTGLLGTGLFLSGWFRSAFVVCLTVTQLWRYASEFLRADYRGQGRISAYQWMGLVSLGYGLILALLFPVFQGTAPDLAAGLAALWSPLTILCLQLLGMLVFYRMGRSDVTAATVSFHIVQDHI
jgi:hypothetical protein